MGYNELNIRNSHGNYKNWRGIYDVRTMRRAIEDCLMAPFEVVWFYPLCITEDNVAYALNELNNLSTHYVHFLDQFVRLFNFDEVFMDMSRPEYQAFVIDGKLDPRYVNGMRILKRRIETEGELLPGSKWEVITESPVRSNGHSPPDNIS